MHAARCLGLTKDFGDGEGRVRALTGVDLEIAYGEITLITGPSGCGKTTLVSVLGGLLERSAGHMEVLGTDPTRLGVEERILFRRRNLGFVFQQYNLLPPLSAEENAAIPLIAAGVPWAEACARAAAVLERLDMGTRRHHLPAQLSGGQQQRVAIARALVHEPRLLVCDEPTAALDSQAGRRVMGMLRDVALSSERAVVIVTHDDRIFHFAHAIARMEDGRVLGLERKTPTAS